jgi:type II secretory pathway component HofQ
LTSPNLAHESIKNAGENSIGTYLEGSEEDLQIRAGLFSIQSLEKASKGLAVKHLSTLKSRHASLSNKFAL